MLCFLGLSFFSCLSFSFGLVYHSMFTGAVKPRGCLTGERLLPLFHCQTVSRLISSVSFLLTVYSLWRNSMQLEGQWVEQSFLRRKNSPQGPAPRMEDLADGVMGILEHTTLVKHSLVLTFFYLSLLFRARSEIQKLAQKKAWSNSPCVY